MDTSIRIVLLLVAGLIICGIVWDSLRSRRTVANRKSIKFKNEAKDPQKGRDLRSEGSELREGRDPRNARDIAITEIHRQSPSSLNKGVTSTANDPKSRAMNDRESGHFDFEDDILLEAVHAAILDSGPGSESARADGSGQTGLGSESRSVGSKSELGTATRSASGSEFEDELEFELEPVVQSKQSNQSDRDPALNEVIIMHVMARQPGFFLGKKLLDAFQEAQLIYGDMHIFHRHEYQDGTGRRLFSVVSAVEPGVFDLSKMDSLVTPGLSLFFMPERRNHSITALEHMLRIGKLLAQRLNGEIRDQDRRPMTLQTIERYRDRVRSLAYTCA